MISSFASRPPCPLTAPELIRRDLGQPFCQLSVAAGLFLRTWKSGPHVGLPKLPPAIQGIFAVGSLLDGTRAFSTDAGFATLPELARNPRRLNPGRYAHAREELGLKRARNEAGRDEGAA